jgi:branched-chain amino acid transport system permease protein
LIFGLLMDNLVFSLNVFAQNGTGVTLNRPSFASAGQGFTYLGLVVFCLIGLVIFNIRRSTTGLALNAVRYSEAGSKIIGISVFQMKVIVAGLAAFVAGIGGAFLGMDNFVALPQNFATLTGVVWLAVLVTSGIRSNVAALIAGLMFSVVPGLFAAYLSPTWGQLPPILFGLGAIGLAMNPDGVIVHHGHQLQSLADWVLRSWSRRHDPQDSAPAEPEPEDATLGPRSADRPNTQLTKVADQP